MRGASGAQVACHLYHSWQEKRFLKGTSVDTLLEGSHIANDKVLDRFMWTVETIRVWESGFSRNTWHFAIFSS